MTYIKKISILCLMVSFMSCSLQKEGEPKIKQGVYGKITWLQGNLMPSPDEPRSMEGKPIERQLNIYEVVTFNEVQGQAPLFKGVNAKLVKTVKSNSQGFYECELPPGNYSIFVLENDGEFFANNFDGKGQINSIEIKRGNKAALNIQINYKAVY